VQQVKMFKEVVSLAIIMGFILNVLYVDHPNTISYTIAFVISLAAISPFVLGWKYRNVLRNLRPGRDVESGESETEVPRYVPVSQVGDTDVQDAPLKDGGVSMDGLSGADIQKVPVDGEIAGPEAS